VQCVERERTECNASSPIPIGNQRMWSVSGEWRERESEKEHACYEHELRMRGEHTSA
jgi:hypothetical protein